MNINLSETEIRALLVALEHTQNLQDEDRQLDEETKLAKGTDQWMKRKFAAEDLSEKLNGVLDTKAKAERMMCGTADPCCEPEALCANDPVNW